MTLDRGILRILSAGIIVLQTACAAYPPAWATPPSAPPVRSATVDQPRGSTVPAQSQPPIVTLSDQAREVSEIAERNGDKNYLMVDKRFGKIILFEDGKAVFIASALTGQNKTDRLPHGSLSKPFSRLGKLEDKVTPAGRFTVSRDYDKAYGELLEINEIQGKDWAIAIHRVYLATRSERRAERLESPDHTDKHITHGCVNVSDRTMLFLLRKLPKTKPAAVVYVLPHDETNTVAYFTRSS